MRYRNSFNNYRVWPKSIYLPIFTIVKTLFSNKILDNFRLHAVFITLPLFLLRAVNVAGQVICL